MGVWWAGITGKGLEAVTYVLIDQLNTFFLNLYKYDTVYVLTDILGPHKYYKKSQA